MDAFTVYGPTDQQLGIPGANPNPCAEWGLWQDTAGNCVTPPSGAAATNLSISEFLKKNSAVVIVCAIAAVALAVAISVRK